jgi:hypothetical protein
MITYVKRVLIGLKVMFLIICGYLLEQGKGTRLVFISVGKRSVDTEVESLTGITSKTVYRFI